MKKLNIENVVNMKLILVAALTMLLVGCTDTTMASMGAYGKPGHIVCYSGTEKIYEGNSTGRIQTVTNSDGWEFQEAETLKFKRISGACVITN